MDELDLVRLTRPPVTGPADDVLARLRIAALGEPADGPAADSVPVDEPAVVELAASPAAPARSGRWRLVAAGVAAAAIIAGGLAVASTRGGDGGIAAPMSDDDVRVGLVGSWSRALNRSSPTGSLLVLVPALVTFAADGGVVVNGPCGPFVSRAHHVEAGTLVLDDPLTSPEGGCVEPAQNEAITSFVAEMSNRPLIRFEDCRTDRAASCTTLRLGDDPEPFLRQGSGDESVGTPTSTITAPSTTIAGAHTPTIDELTGHDYRLSSIDGATWPGRQVVLTFGPQFAVHAEGDCTALGAASVADGRLVVQDLLPVETIDGPAGLRCPADDALRSLVVGSPSVTKDGTTLTLSGGGTTAVFEDFAAALAGPHTPSLAELRGRRFRVTVFRQDMRAIELLAAPEITVADQLTFRTECNDGYGAVSITGGRLVVGDWFATKSGCPHDDDVKSWLTGSPIITLDGPVMRLTTPNYDAELIELVGLVDGVPATTTSIGLAPPSTSFPTIPLLPAVTLDQIAGRTFEGPGPAGVVRFRIEPDGSYDIALGCNTAVGRAEITGGRFVVDTIDRTLIFCGPGEDDVDALLRARPVLTLRGSELVLSSERLQLRLVEQAMRPVVGAWRTNGAFDPVTTSYAGLERTLVLAADGTWTYDSPCSGRSGTYAVDGSMITFTVGPVPTGTPCTYTSGQFDEESRLLTLLAGAATFDRSGDALRLTRADGTGEIFRPA